MGKAASSVGLGDGLDAENQLIFISIASYRDAQLVPTIADLLAKADEPELLRFGICWQHGEDEAALPYAGDERFRIQDVDWRESRGACWARAEVMRLWQGEQWFLQVDSHCRFIDGWDTKLIRMMSQTESAKPILSTYANGFTPLADGEQGREVLMGVPQRMAIETFTEQGMPVLKPLPIGDAASRKRPVTARFLAAGFLFAPGRFVTEVPYDPELYFFGEEISMTMRAFTSGYDLFHPVENVVWHDYVRAYATRHWDDHAQSPAGGNEQREAAHLLELQEVGGPEREDNLSGPYLSEPEVSGPELGGPELSHPDLAHPDLSHLDRLSRQKVERQVCGDSEGGEPFGLGTVRTRDEYERYAGISFRLRKIQDYTRLALDPPNPEIAADWPERIYSWLVRVAVPVKALPIGALDETSFWVVTIQDEERREFRRHDFQRRDIQATGEESEIALVCEIESGIIPAYWTVQPYSKAHGWGSMLQGVVADGDYTIVTD